MKGIVFNLLDECVVAEHGEDTWDDLLEDAGVSGSYTSLGNYPDDELLRLVGAVSERLGIEPEKVVRWLGRSSLPRLADRYPGFFTPHTATRPFLLSLNDIIHPEVRKLYPGAGVPTFDFSETDEGALVMSYRSARRLCAFGEGLIEGAAGHYGEQVSLAQPVCMNRGGEHCRIEVTLWQSA